METYSSSSADAVRTGKELTHLIEDNVTYAGTWITLVKNLGFSEEQAKDIEEKYHALYKESDEWVAAHIDNATRVGYVVGAFGLRLRTPILGQTLLRTRQTPHEAEAEARTAGNALGQSYGLLNNRVLIKVMEEVYQSKYSLDIKPVASIHDATYYIIKDDAEVIEWLNECLIRHMDWQDLPDLRHETVGLGGELSIFYPNWASELELPNGVDTTQITELASKFINESK